MFMHSWRQKLSTTRDERMAPLVKNLYIKAKHTEVVKPIKRPCCSCTFLELLQHGVQLGVVEDEMQRVVVELGDGCHGCAVIWIHQSQIFHVEDFHDVGPATPKCRLITGHKLAMRLSI